LRAQQPQLRHAGIVVYRRKPRGCKEDQARRQKCQRAGQAEHAAHCGQPLPVFKDVRGRPAVRNARKTDTTLIKIIGEAGSVPAIATLSIAAKNCTKSITISAYTHRSQYFFQAWCGRCRSLISASVWFDVIPASWRTCAEAAGHMSQDAGIWFKGGTRQKPSVVMAGLVQACPGHPRLGSSPQKDVDTWHIGERSDAVLWNGYGRA
ncbi:MAG: hypothetical protein WBD95_16585, partial [Xanthobacteraceae bacterium]